MEIVESSPIPRKTVIVGTMSGYRGSASSKYRNVAKKALEVADTVCFYGKQAHIVDKLAGDYPGRLHSFDDASVLNEFLNEHRQPGDLIYVKSTRADHLDRLWIDLQKPIDCWLDACGRDQDCHTCERLYDGLGKEDLPISILREV